MLIIQESHKNGSKSDKKNNENKNHYIAHY